MGGRYNMKNYRVVKSKTESKVQYFYITINKKDYVLNKDLETVIENGRHYVVFNDSKLGLIFQ